ncbi:hypothetical protein [Photorhabdus bodei]|uniref:Uncharacterized protein n=1 Tax=Photorhabdus bodei TaxID=2029681 RepID=A0ABX0AP76_9GAMM|nr:hypothetical protein [Photorhabdus bodei]NDK99704.1 hypothetical protein [Photorhabdus bodei]NDL04788.1 hypothetical protein [Photorhabdus bodei]NDL08426.1 hypothetical protein [Photorhabdus bodei]
MEKITRPIGIFYLKILYTLWISRYIATASKRIPGSIGNYVTGVSECSQQRGNLKDNGYISVIFESNKNSIKITVYSNF